MLFLSKHGGMEANDASELSLPPAGFTWLGTPGGKGATSRLPGPAVFFWAPFLLNQYFVGGQVALCCKISAWVRLTAFAKGPN